MNSAVTNSTAYNTTVNTYLCPSDNIAKFQAAEPRSVADLLRAASSATSTYFTGASGARR